MLVYLWCYVQRGLVMFTFGPLLGFISVYGVDNRFWLKPFLFFGLVCHAFFYLFSVPFAQFFSDKKGHLNDSSF